MGPFSLASQNAGEAELSVGDYFDNPKEKEFTELHNDVHGCVFDGAESIFSRAHTVFGKTPTDLMPPR